MGHREPFVARLYTDFALGVAWLALVVAEQVNANAGLGFMISQATQFLRNDVILVALAVYAVLGLITDGLVRLPHPRYPLT